MNKLKFLTLTTILVMAAMFVVPHLQFVEASAAANDDFYSATVIANLPFSETLDTTEASTGDSDPWPCGYSPNNSVWYSYTPSESGPVQIITSGSSYNTAVGVFTGDYNGGLSQVNCTSGNNNLNVYLDEGISYSIMVVGIGYGYPYPIGNYGGTLQISLVQQTGPVNDNFANAKIVDPLPYDDYVDNTYATSEPGEPSTGCSWGGPKRSIWYAFTPSTNGKLEIYAGLYYSYINVYTGNSLQNLSEFSCANYGTWLQVNLSSNTSYYIQIGSLDDWNYGSFGVTMNFTPAPPNDNFADAIVALSLPFSKTINNDSASTEPGEPYPGCSWGGMYRTIWYAYTPTESGSITFQRSGYYDSFTAVYTGSSIDQLNQLRCAAYEYNHFTIQVDPGITYYIQLGSTYYYGYGDLTLDLYVAPPPNPDFWWSPSDANRYDMVQLCDGSNDPGGEGFNYFWWNFGDGTQQDGPDGCVNHQFSADGDYTVWHKVQTTDGRTAEISKSVSVRTHDVGIKKFSVPQSAKVGQTRNIVVGIQNNKYPENVTVELFKSTPYGYTWVGTLNQFVPVRSSNRTTDFTFSYTFTNDDGRIGKVTFKAVAILNNARDAMPGDNEAISLSTKVTGYKPYSATVVEPPNLAGVGSTFGLLALGLVFGLIAISHRRQSF